MVKLNKKTSFLILIVLLSIFIVGVGTFSIIDESVDNLECTMEIGGGSCNLLLNLPKNQKVSSGYSFDVEVENIADENFSDPILLQPKISGGPYTKDYFKSYYYKEHSYIDLFEIPVDYINPYQIKIENTISPVSINTNGRFYGYMDIGFLNQQYLKQDIEICDDYEGKDFCAEDYIFTDYIDRNGYERVYDGKILSKVTSQEEYIYVRETRLENLNLHAIGVFDARNLDDYNRFVYSKQLLRDKYSSSTKSIADDKFYISYKQEHLVEDLKITIGSEIVKIYPGIVDNGLIFIPDISQEINEYCGRNEDNLRGCLVKIKFESKDGGLIKINDEFGVLEKVTKPVIIDDVVVEPEFEESPLTGFISFDFENRPVNTIMSSIISLLILLLVGYLIFGGKK